VIDFLVIGVRDGFAWFRIDGDRGASYWDNIKNWQNMLDYGGFGIIDDVHVPQNYSKQEMGDGSSVLLYTICNYKEYQNTFGINI
jgi:hypothetical protein